MASISTPINTPPTVDTSLSDKSPIHASSTAMQYVKKAQIKVELLPRYSAWVEGVLVADGARQDDVVMFVMLWRID
ncbi:hypothetical protein GXB74_31655, partial [Klebsiella pneumoniae]|nr:hypothetical protein [Klebsiella pneumoniae]